MSAPHPWHAVALESELIAVLHAPLGPGERLEAGFRRKEHALGELFARLSVADCRELHRRLSSSAAGDPIATRFSRLIFERRARLLAFLADARRREATAGTRRPER